MLSLLSAELLDQCGLTDSENPMIVVTVAIEEGGENPVVFLTPRDGEDGPFAALITRRIKENTAPKRPGRYVWKIRQYEELETHADDREAARFLFSLFRRDLGPVFEAMEEMLRSLPSKARLQEALDDLICRQFVHMIKDHTFIDPRELCLGVLCQECGPHNLNLRNENVQHELRELARVIEETFVRFYEKGETFSKATIAHKQRLIQRLEQITNAQPIKDSELFLASTVFHDHPFFDLNVQLLTEAGNAMLRERALIVTVQFLQMAKNFSADLDALIR